MAKSDAVWGIDIGQCALKALRCRPHEDGDKITADAFDCIEYPKILSQPEAEPAELIHDALTEFLSRNDLRGDRVAISVSGQSGLARFIKLPPVESKKIPDIVKYEARQQIPFALDDVIWDYQQMAGGSEEDGFALETEVGLFAMKRDQVFRALKPFDRADIEVDIIQLTPLALYNYVSFDQLHDLPPPEEYDPDNPPKSIVVLSMGTDTTDLVVTNGYRVWQRSIPLGGSHFTKALTKELKLTFAKAEHLKRHAAAAEDPKALFQAMRPVFNDLLTEVQRSIGFFQNVDRTAKIGRAIALGNALKLPGLQRYLQQNLGIDVQRVDSFRGLAGASVVEAPAFKENVLGFGVAYGLCLQGLVPTQVKTNMIPPEIVKDRLIRSKKPWAVAAAAVLLLGCTINFASYWRSWDSAALAHFSAPMGQATTVSTTAITYEADFTAQKEAFSKIDNIARNIVHNVLGRMLWLEVTRAINAALPRDPVGAEIEDPTKRNELHIVQIETQRLDEVDAQKWLAWVKQSGWLREDPAAPAARTDATDGTAGTDPAGPNAAPPANPAAPAEDPADVAADPTLDGGDPLYDTASTDAAEVPEGEQGPAWLIQIVGYHYHNPVDRLRDQGADFVEKTLIQRLRQDKVTVQLPDGSEEEVPVAAVGIHHPVLIAPGPINWDYEVIDPEAIENGILPGAGGREDESRRPNVRQRVFYQQQGMDTPGMKKQPRFEFVVQCLWRKLPEEERDELNKELEKIAITDVAPVDAAADAAADAAPPADADLLAPANQDLPIPEDNQDGNNQDNAATPPQP